ncbi:lycopene cyclase family protein [Gordonia polyisoprenivorans]|uniref:lycopene cyclase family protein n=1 Tax=Gordonia polyisoprenivorans TaxID=84595 RepID=UPI001AD6828A|nr:lycopene cyclase family protein [Gordonia polyisoprenivorans]QTI67086.1 FAD-dependent monooxygenase [Gordonia polyisoprenivorans]
MRGRTAIVVGAGPAGRALAHRLAHHGVPVTLIDSRVERRWTATYAAWTDELPAWLDDSVIAARTASVAAHAIHRRHIPRGYSVFDTVGLQRRLHLDGVDVVEARTRHVAADRVITDDGKVHRGATVFDCRGAAADGPSARAAPRQTAFGIVVGRDEAAPVLDGAEAVLMDWRAPREGPPWSPRGAAPSFLYAVPVGDDAILLEETCLIGRPALPVAELADRLTTRLAGHGITGEGARHRERVSFPVLIASPTPWRLEPLRFGAAGGFVNPTTGYGVATALRWADTAARAVADDEDTSEVLWPWRARQVWRLRLRGAAVLLGLDPVQTVRFFDAFLALPLESQRSYLSERTDLTGTLAAMRRVFAALDQPTRTTLVRRTMRGRA